MIDVIYLDEYRDAVDGGAEIHKLIDGIMDMLAEMTKEEHLDWFLRTQYPYPINFEAEIDSTVYSVNTRFDSTASESLEEKAERIIMKNL